jgi:hypothetical protein
VPDEIDRTSIVTRFVERKSELHRNENTAVRFVTR